MSCFDKAKDKILLGTLRDESVSDREKKITAYHEAGHALLALLLPGADPVHSVTIVPRGRALGVTQQLPSEEIFKLLPHLPAQPGGDLARRACCRRTRLR